MDWFASEYVHPLAQNGKTAFSCSQLGEPAMHPRESRFFVLLGEGVLDLGLFPMCSPNMFPIAPHFIPDPLP